MRIHGTAIVVLIAAVAFPMAAPLPRGVPRQHGPTAARAPQHVLQHSAL